jgi:hypothetical protein
MTGWDTVDAWILNWRDKATWIAGIAFFIAFIFTIWTGKWRPKAAAILYAVGILANIGWFSYSLFFRVRLSYGLSDSPNPQPFPIVFGFLFPLTFLAYSIAACVFLWPSISQAKAILAGKILHLGVLPILVVYLMIVTAPPTHDYYMPRPFDLKWLIYGIL